MMVINTSVTTLVTCVAVGPGGLCDPDGSVRGHISGFWDDKEDYRAMCV